MNHIDLTTRTRHGAHRSAIGAATAGRRPERARWTGVVAGAATFALLGAMVGCSGDDADDPSAPTSTVAAVGSFPDQPSGVGVPLEPGSNLPPGAGEGGGEGDRGSESEMDVDGDGIGDGDG